MEEQTSDARVPERSQLGETHWCRQLIGLASFGELDPDEVSPETTRLMRDGVPPDDWSLVIGELMIHGTPRILRIVFQNLRGRLRRLVLSSSVLWGEKASRRLEGLRLLFEWQRADPCLVSLELRGLSFDADEIEMLYEGFKGNSTLEDLRLVECKFAGATWRLFASVFSCPRLTRLQVDIVESRHWSDLVQAFRFAQVGSSPAPLRTLVLRGEWLSLADARFLADGLQHLRTVTSLKLGSEWDRAMAVPEAWVAVLDALRHVATLEHFEMTGVQMTQECADALAGLIDASPRLKAIAIDHLMTGVPEDVDCVRLGAALKRLSKIELTRFPADPSGSHQILSQLCASASLVSLALNGLNLRKADAAGLMVDLVKQNRLRELRLMFMGRGQLQPIVDAMQDNRSIVSLVLQGDDPVLSLSALTANRFIKNLSLGLTDLSSSSPTELAALVCNHPSIEVLDLGDGNLDAAAVRAVADALATSRSIRRLHLHDTQGIKTELDYVLQRLRSNQGLIELSVSASCRDPKWGRSSAPNVLAALQEHLSLQHLDYKKFLSGHAACPEIERLLERNRRAAQPEVVQRLHEALRGFARLMGGCDDIGQQLWEQLLVAAQDEGGAPLFESTTSLRAAVALSEVVQGAKAARQHAAPALGSSAEPVTKRARGGQPH